jgi:hypothetical protein
MKKSQKQTLMAAGLMAITAIISHYFEASVAGVLIAGIFTPGPLVGEIRNKIGSVVFSRNHFGGFIRKRIKPVNPRSEAQTLARSGLKFLAQNFRNLTQIQIAGWNSLSKKRTKHNKLGYPITLTGESTSIELNRNLQAIGESTIDTAPSIDLDCVANLLGVVFGSASGVITINATAKPASGLVAELASSGIVSSGRTYNSLYKQFALIKNSDTLPKTITTSWTNIFGTAPVAGEVVFFRLRVIDVATGYASLYQSYRVVAT